MPKPTSAPRFLPVIATAIAITAAAGGAQIRFEDVSMETMDAYPDNARGSAAADLDHNGWPDVFTGISRRTHLYVSSGVVGPTLRLRQRTDDTGLATLSERIGGGAVFGDYDNDGDLDLFVPLGTFQTDDRSANRLLRNDRGSFTDVAADLGLTASLPTDNAVWLDYDRDGWLDLYTANLACNPPDASVRNRLYRNMEGLGFVDVTEEAGLDVVISDVPPSADTSDDGCYGGSNGGLLATDFDGDGWTDLYVGAFRDANRLFLNDGAGAFIDASGGDISHTGQAYNAAAGDVNNDGRLDILQASGGGFTPGDLEFQEENSILLLNLGSGSFADIISGSGLETLSRLSLLAANLADFDNDGDLDLVAADAESRPWVFANDGDGRFTDVTASAGVRHGGWGTAILDVDRDGFVDLWFGGGGGGLLRSTPNGNHWLRVELVGVESNRSAVGARVTAVSGELRQVRQILGGNGYNQDEMVAHFGLGARTSVDALEIRWPSGQITTLRDIPVDGAIRVIEGQDRWHPATPDRWQHDLPDRIVDGTQVPVRLEVWPALFDTDAMITSVNADLSRFGGLPETTLEPAGEGRYVLETSLTAADVGRPALDVWIEQSTSLGPRWSRLSWEIAVLPRPEPLNDLVLYDAEDDGLQALNFFGQADTTEAPAVAGAPVLGFTSGKTFAAAWFLPPDTPAHPWSSLRFSFHPGDALVPSQSGIAGEVGKPMRNRDGEIIASIDGTNRSLILAPFQIDLANRNWQHFEVPLGPAAQQGIEDLSMIVIYGDFAGTVYMDDVRLVAADSTQTAVTEAAGAAPGLFALQQNYPNPFNSSTVITYALPAAGPVRLDLYNALGQRVARLVDGERPAGVHHYAWDGSDGRGHALATGTYFYRLQAGGRIQTRQLTLLR